MNLDQYADPLFASSLDDEDDSANHRHPVHHHDLASTLLTDENEGTSGVTIASSNDMDTSTAASTTTIASDTKYVLKCLVPDKSAGAIIGKGGSTISKIQSDSGARVKISKHGVLFPGTRSRILMIFSSGVANVISALGYVVTCLYNEASADTGGFRDATMDDSIEETTELRLLVPSSCAGIVIGKGGSVIKDVMAKSGANVKLSNKRDMVPGVLERMVIIRGSLEQQVASSKTIFAIMHSDAECSAKSSYANPTVEYRVGGGGYGGGYHHRGPTFRHHSDFSSAGATGATPASDAFPIPDSLVGAVIGQETGYMKMEEDGVFYADIRIGSPPQDFTVIVDTGSATIAVPCHGCQKCGSKHAQFDIAKSSSAHNSGGQYQQCYAEGSCNKGSMITDVMCIGEGCTPDEMITHAFGCCTTYAKAFQSQEADGIIGFGGSQQTLIRALRNHHNLDSNEFGMCVATEGGRLTIGGYPQDIMREPLTWIGGVNLNSYYHITVASVSVAGESPHVVGKGALVDSGTSFTYVPSAAWSAMKSQFARWCSVSADRCRGSKDPPSAVSMDRRDAVACYQPPHGIPHDDGDWLSTFPSISFKMSTGDYIAMERPRS
eukprot:g2681.t1